MAANSKRDYIGEDGFENINKLTLEDFYDSTINDVFKKHNSSVFEIDEEDNIRFKCDIYDSKEEKRGEYYFSGKSVGLAFEKFAAGVFVSIAKFPLQRYEIMANPVARFFFSIYSMLLTEKEINAIKKLCEQDIILNEIESGVKWIISKDTPVREFNQDDIFNEFAQQENNIIDRIIDDYNRVERGNNYPNSLFLYIMQFPKRFQSTWVLNLSSFNNYSERFLYEWSILLDKTRINPITDDRPYNWFLHTFLGNDKIEPLFPRVSLSCPSINIDNNCIDTILADGDIHFADLWYCALWGEPKGFVLAKYDMTMWLSFLKTMCKTHFINEWEMMRICPDRIEESIKRDPDNPDIIINIAEIMETLGCYDSKEKAIYICDERIKKTAEELRLSAEILFYIVYIHELAHAAMDETLGAKEDPETYYNEGASYFLTSIKEDAFPLSDKCANYMEESLANLITLNYLDWYSEVTEDQRYYDAAIKFIGQQAPMYAFGVDQLNATVDWTKWRDYKKKNKEPDKKLLAWYDKFFDASGEKKDIVYSKEDFDVIFD